MHFNCIKEKQMFDEDFKRKKTEYIEAGMNESVIDRIYQFDLEQFYSNQIFYKKNILTFDYSAYEDKAVKPLL